MNIDEEVTQLVPRVRGLGMPADPRETRPLQTEPLVSLPLDMQRGKTRGGDTLARLNAMLRYSGVILTIRLSATPQHPYGGQFPVLQLRPYTDLTGHHFTDIVCYDRRIGQFTERVPWWMPYGLYLGDPVERPD